MRHTNIYITGKVHGVGLRYFLREQALKLGLKGFIRNEPDGTVYIEVEGNDPELNRFMEVCRAGNGSAQVHHVRTNPDVLKSFTTFTIAN